MYLIKLQRDISFLKIECNCSLFFNLSSHTPLALICGIETHSIAFKTDSLLSYCSVHSGAERPQEKKTETPPSWCNLQQQVFETKPSLHSEA